MVLRVADTSKKIVGIKNLYIATEGPLIENVVSIENYRTIITSKKCFDPPSIMEDLKKLDQI